TILAGAPVVVDQQVPAQSREPGGERAFIRAVALKRSEHSQKNLLGQILGFGILTRKTIAKAVHPAGVRTDQSLPGGLVPAEASFDEVEIGIQAISCQRWRRLTLTLLPHVVPVRVVGQWRPQLMCDCRH